MTKAHLSMVLGSMLLVACGNDGRDAFTKACVKVLQCDDDAKAEGDDAITARCEQDTKQEADNADAKGCASQFQELATCLDDNTATCDAVRDVRKTCDAEDDALGACSRD
jgi:hypothetical protein